MIREAPRKTSDDPHFINCDYVHSFTFIKTACKICTGISCHAQHINLSVSSGNHPLNLKSITNCKISYQTFSNCFLLIPYKEKDHFSLMLHKFSNFL